MNQAALAEATVDKKAEEKRNLRRDQELLIEMGKFIPLEMQVVLSERIAVFFKQPPPAAISIDDALTYQAHLILHLLNDAVIPVVRTEVLGLVQLRCLTPSFAP